MAVLFYLAQLPVVVTVHDELVALQCCSVASILLVDLLLNLAVCIG
jgi:threonine/homoserine/homoserine lactone efflux protein